MNLIDGSLVHFSAGQISHAFRRLIPRVVLRTVEDSKGFLEKNGANCTGLAFGSALGFGFGFDFALRLVFPSPTPSPSSPPPSVAF